MRHDGTDERDPNFNAYKDFQSQNDYITAQLNVMGYIDDLLRAQLHSFVWIKSGTGEPWGRWQSQTRVSVKRHLPPRTRMARSFL